jgi:hypothetical protein
MNQPQAEIERVVREVLAELGVAPGGTVPSRTEFHSVQPRNEATGRSETPSHEDGRGETPSHGGGNGQLVLDCRVVTMSHLAGRLDAVKLVVVSPQAIVTPAVRDELYRRNIVLSSGSAAKTQPDGARLVTIIAGRFDPTALVTALRNNGVPTEAETMDCLIAATARLATEVKKPNTRGLLLTRHTAAALCLANRHRNVRAILGPDAAAVAVAAAAVGANVLVADPTAAGFSQLKQAVLEFYRGGPRECPAVFREQLT